MSEAQNQAQTLSASEIDDITKDMLGSCIFRSCSRNRA